MVAAGATAAPWARYVAILGLVLGLAVALWLLSGPGPATGLGLAGAGAGEAAAAAASAGPPATGGPAARQRPALRAGDGDDHPGDVSDMATPAAYRDVTANRTALGLPYLLRVPAASSSAKLPLVIFLHGAGESGTDPWGLLPGFNAVTGKWRDPAPVRGTPPGLAVDGSPLVDGLIIAAPVTNRRWESPAVHKAVLGLIDEVSKSSGAVDPARVYVTGISMGGGGTFSLAAAAPERFAAAAPICGFGDTDIADKLKAMPLWVAHGTNDVVVPFDASAELVEAIQAAGNKQVQFKAFEAAFPAGNEAMTGHDAWTQTYADPAFWAWLTKQAKAA